MKAKKPKRAPRYKMLSMAVFLRPKDQLYPFRCRTIFSRIHPQ